MISVTKKYLLWQRSLYQTSTGNLTYFDLPLNAIVDAIDGQIENGRQLVEYRDRRGWVELDYLETYAETLDRFCVDLIGIQTPEENDAQQYIIIDGKKVVNACGMISCAFVLGMSLVDTLKNWGQTYPSHYKYVTTVEKWLTGANDLIAILQPVQAERLVMRRYSPSGIKNLLRKAIIAVTINSYTGRLSTKGIRHWVVPVDIFLDRQGYGTIDIYNPFPNRVERYSWNEFIASAGNVNGVIIKGL